MSSWSCERPSKGRIWRTCPAATKPRPGRSRLPQLDSSGPRLQQELERLQAALRQTEAREIEWREKAQHLALSLAQSKASVSSSEGGAALLFYRPPFWSRDSEQQRLGESHRGGKTLGPSAPQDVRKGEVKDTSTQWNPG